MMLNIEATSICLADHPRLRLVSRMNAPAARLLLGVLINAAGLMLAGATHVGFICLFGVFVFALGEMTGAPRCGNTWPSLHRAGKRRFYMGYTTSRWPSG